MTRSGSRLLAAFSLILAAPLLVRGQDAARDRFSAFGPVPTPQISLRAPVRIPLFPNLAPRYPTAHGTNVFQQPIFERIVGAAGIIFSGRVIFIGHPPSPNRADPASNTITFQVEHAIRGTVAGQSLTIHEWAGLWSSGERYRVGEHVLLFLYSPSRLGLTSPVAGAMGRFAMDSQGQVMLNALHFANLAEDPFLGGKTVVPYIDFALAVRRASGKP